MTTVPPVEDERHLARVVLGRHRGEGHDHACGKGKNPDSHRGIFVLFHPCLFTSITHPLVHDALMELRDARTAPPAFRRAANRISVLLAAEALRDLPSSAATVTTPLGPADGRVVLTDVVVVPVLRAGLGHARRRAGIAADGARRPYRSAA